MVATVPPLTCHADEGGICTHRYWIRLLPVVLVEKLLLIYCLLLRRRSIVALSQGEKEVSHFGYSNRRPDTFRHAMLNRMERPFYRNKNPE
jgi:hypothetical protein